MSDHLRTIAERFVAAYDGMESILGPVEGTHFAGPLDDAVKVCRAWLDDHPADDNEPVGSAWLVSLGFVDVADASDDELYTVYDDHGGPALTLESDDQRRWMAYLGSANDDVWPCDIYVRAQVRQLLTALGVRADPA